MVEIRNRRCARLLSLLLVFPSHEIVSRCGEADVSIAVSVTGRVLCVEIATYALGGHRTCVTAGKEYETDNYLGYCI